jgi:hypothetical protein
MDRWGYRDIVSIIGYMQYTVQNEYDCHSGIALGSVQLGVVCLRNVRKKKKQLEAHLVEHGAEANGPSPMSLLSTNVFHNLRDVGPSTRINMEGGALSAASESNDQDVVLEVFPKTNSQ